jgi:hypothetical protein
VLRDMYVAGAALLAKTHGRVVPCFMMILGCGNL